MRRSPYLCLLFVAVQSALAYVFAQQDRPGWAFCMGLVVGINLCGLLTGLTREAKS